MTTGRKGFIRPLILLGRGSSTLSNGRKDGYSNAYLESSFARRSLTFARSGESSWRKRLQRSRTRGRKPHKREQFANLCPLVPESVMCFRDDPIFCLGPVVPVVVVGVSFRQLLSVMFHLVSPLLSCLDLSCAIGGILVVLLLCQGLSCVHIVHFVYDFVRKNENSKIITLWLFVRYLATKLSSCTWLFVRLANYLATRLFSGFIKGKYRIIERRRQMVSWGENGLAGWLRPRSMETRRWTRSWTPPS